MVIFGCAFSSFWACAQLWDDHWIAGEACATFNTYWKAQINYARTCFQMSERKAPAKQGRWYFGGLASAGAACCTHPLDLLKVRRGDGMTFRLAKVALYLVTRFYEGKHYRYIWRVFIISDSPLFANKSGMIGLSKRAIHESCQHWNDTLLFSF